jgi:hypothetical protein
VAEVVVGRAEPSASARRVLRVDGHSADRIDGVRHPRQVYATGRDTPHGARTARDAP